MTFLSHALAYTPFIDSLQATWPDASAYWMWLLAPLVIAISLVYRGTKVRHLADLPKAASWLALQIVLVMAGAAAALYGIHYFFIRAV